MIDKILVIASDFYFDLDCEFYKNYNIEHFKFNDNSSYSELKEKTDLISYKKIIFLVDDMIFDCVSKLSDPFDVSQSEILYTEPDKDFLNNWNVFKKDFPSNVIYILYDNRTESPQKSFIRYINTWLDSDENHFLISCRLYKLNHPRAITNLLYLPLIFSFNQNSFNKYNKLKYSRPNNSSYNFISYLGHSQKKEKRKFRYSFLKELLEKRFSEVEIEPDSNNGKGLKYFPMPNYEGHTWNVLECLFSKIQLIFETIPPDKEFHDEYFFTEKTSKLFVLPHPYFLFVHGTALEQLEKYGFKFSVKCYSMEDYKKEIKNMLDDLDEWINQNDSDFYHNHENMYQISSSDKLLHHIFMDTIINKK